jgi:hypothetical protein
MPDVAPLYVTVNADGTINTFQQSGFSSGKTITTGLALGPPPNSQAGDPLRIKETGDYIFSLSGSGYSPVVGLQYLELWLNGQPMFNTKLYFNEINEWHTFPTAVYLVNITKGIHYIWLYVTGLSDANSVGTWEVIPA